jgi:hypothetical protein
MHTFADATTSDAQSQMFFAAKGVDVAKHARALKGIDLSRVYEALGRCLPIHTVSLRCAFISLLVMLVLPLCLSLFDVVLSRV